MKHAIVLAALVSGCWPTTEHQQEAAQKDMPAQEARRSAKRTAPTAGSTKSTGPTAAAAPTKPVTWTKVLELKGTGMKQSPVFALEGGNQRIRYASKCGASICVFSAYVLPEGHNLIKQGGFPELMVTESDEGESGLTRAKGRYYVKVNANSRWSIVVEEAR